MKNASLWIVAVIAFPVGVLLGALLGSTICVVILAARGMGHSHNDVFTIAFSQLAGAAVGAILLPMLAWHLEGRRKRLLETKRSRSIE